MERIIFPDRQVKPQYSQGGMRTPQVHLYEPAIKKPFKIIKSLFSEKKRI
jgi:hypothetical protein